LYGSSGSVVMYSLQGELEDLARLKSSGQDIVRYVLLRGEGGGGGQKYVKSAKQIWGRTPLIVWGT
jgi:hypothetical protein